MTDDEALKERMDRAFETMGMKIHRQMFQRYMEQLRERPFWVPEDEPWPPPPPQGLEKWKFDFRWWLDGKLYRIRHGIGDRICTHDHWGCP